MGTTLHGADAVKRAEELFGRTLTPQESHIVMAEGYKDDWYDDTKGIPTKNFGQTGEYADMPFPDVVNIFEDKTRGIVSDYDNLPQELQLRLLDSTYRGGLSGSPDTLKLANSGQWGAAADEFLNNKEYRLAVESGSGVATRMKETSDAMRAYGVELNSVPQQAQAVPQQAQAVPQQVQEAPPQEDAGFLSSVDDFINSWFGGNQSGKPRKEVTAMVPKASKDTTEKSIWDTLFGD